MADVSINNIVVLVDMYTRKAVESITYEALVRHVSVITDIREISESYFGCDLVIFEPAVPAVVTPEILNEMKAVYGLNPHLIYATPEIGEMFSTLANCVKADYRMLEWNLIYAVVNHDSAILGPYQKSRVDQFDFASVIDNLSPDAVKPVNQLYSSYLNLFKDYNRLVGQNARLTETVENYRSVGRRTTEAIEELKRLLEEATEENRTYCAMLSESYDVTFNGMYPERPRVIYIKSISHLSGVDSLIMTLYGVLVKQYKVSCKIVKLVDNSNAASVRYIPNVYTPLHDTYSTETVLLNDFLVSLGAYNMLMSLLLMNRSELDFLIVHDMRGTLNSALDESLIDLRLNELSGDYAVLGEYDNILSDLEDKSPFVWNFKEVSEFTGSNVTKLANHPTIGKILDHLL